MCNGMWSVASESHGWKVGWLSGLHLQTWTTIRPSCTADNSCGTLSSSFNIQYQQYMWRHLVLHIYATYMLFGYAQVDIHTYDWYIECKSSSSEGQVWRASVHAWTVERTVCGLRQWPGDWHLHNPDHLPLNRPNAEANSHLAHHNIP